MKKYFVFILVIILCLLFCQTYIFSNTSIIKNENDIEIDCCLSYQIGHKQEVFYDSSRNNRSVLTEIYYPANISGDNFSVANGNFPVIVFGHGFVMSWDAYENLWTEFVSRGYIMVFPRTESSIFGTNHQEFGWDLQFLVSRMQVENELPSSIFHNKIAEETALMGHSMGGGAAFLAADSLCTIGNKNLKTLIGFAPAESSSNGVSSINSAKNIIAPSIIFSATNDGVTKTDDHHKPLFNNITSTSKYFINILGGGHCYYANTNFNCDFGESVASKGINISRQQQQDIVFDFVNLWLDYTLKHDSLSFGIFQDSLKTSKRILVE